MEVLKEMEKRSTQWKWKKKKPEKVKQESNFMRNCWDLGITKARNDIILYSMLPTKDLHTHSL